MSLEILEAKDAIREIIDHFSNLECDVAAQRELFTPDAHIMVRMGGKLAMDIHGAEEMVQQFGAFTASVKASHHMNGQQVIAVDGETATDTHYCRAALLTTEDGADYFSDNYIRYTDTLKKIDGVWKISVRDQEFVMSEKRKA